MCKGRGGSEMGFQKKFTAIFILVLWSLLVPLQAGPVSSPGQISEQAQQDKAKAKRQELKQKVRRSRQAGQQVRQTLTAQERKQFAAITRLAKKSAYDARARKQLRAKWKVFIKSHARRKGKMNINMLVHAAMYPAWQEQEQGLGKAFLRAQKANKEIQQLRAELRRTRQYQQKMKTRPGKFPAYQPARIKGVNSTRPIRSQAQMNTLMTDIQNNMSTMNDLNQQTMLALQHKMEQQERMMQMMSNIMKTMHDTAQSIVSNLR